MASYRIKGENLTAIADRVRSMAQINQALTVEQIIYWLGRLRPLLYTRTEVDGSATVNSLTVAVDATLIQEETT